MKDSCVRYLTLEFVALCAILFGAGTIIGQTRPVVSGNTTGHAEDLGHATNQPNLGDCGIALINHGPNIAAKPSANAVPTGVWNCIPPYENPTYSAPPNDSVAFDSLLEASGYTSAANSNWLGVAAGTFCGRSGKLLILVQNQEPNFSVMHGPAPYRRYPGGIANLDSSTSFPWRAVAGANLDDSGQDSIVAVRKITAKGVPDLIVAKVTNCECSALDEAAGKCELPTMVASAAIGDPVNSDWVGAAVGNFDGTGKKIALLKTAHDNLFLVKLTSSSNTLSIVYAGDLPKIDSKDSAWKALAAGDIDGDGLDELIVARQVSDHQSPTVLVYKWNAAAADFRLLATSTFGNEGNSNWASATAGDFNADGRQAVVLVKDRHSNFALMDFPPGATQLRVLATNDLDSKPGQTWTGLAATDWIGGDQGASELVAVRTVHSPYRTNIFVYGNQFHRVSRDTALDLTKAQWANSASIDDLKNWIRSTHTNTFLWLLNGPGDYLHLVQFLHETKDWGVDGKQLRVWFTLVPPRYVTTPVAPANGCSQPEPTPGLTTWNALDFFQQDFAQGTPDQKTMAACRDMLAWFSVAGRLARDFPQLVGVAIDDFSEQLDFSDPVVKPFTPDMIAAMESNMRARAAWMNFSPYIYYSQSGDSNWADLLTTLDSMVFFFRNDKRGVCIGPIGCDQTIANAPDEVSDMSQLLPSGRKMLLGIYFVGLWSEPKPNQGKLPTVPYDYNLTRLALIQPVVGSAVAYGLQTPSLACTPSNYLQDRFCALQRAYGDEIGIETPTVSFSGTPLKGIDTRTATIKNLGVTEITVNIPPSPAFKIATFFWDGGTFVIAPGQTLSVEITFIPRMLGNAQGTLTITSNTLGSPYSMVLNGVGIKGSVP